MELSLSLTSIYHLLVHWKEAELSLSFPPKGLALSLPLILRGNGTVTYTVRDWGAVCHLNSVSEEMVLSMKLRGIGAVTVI